jgi:hypothetical protein
VRANLEVGLVPAPLLQAPSEVPWLPTKPLHLPGPVPQPGLLVAGTVVGVVLLLLQQGLLGVCWPTPPVPLYLLATHKVACRWGRGTVGIVDIGLVLGDFWGVLRLLLLMMRRRMHLHLHLLAGG